MKGSIALSILLASLSGMSLAQSGQGIITGVISDASGAEVAGAQVTITSQTTGLEARVVSTTSGVFRAPNLTPGRYRVVVTLRGFKTAVKENVELLLGQTVTAGFRLEVGDLAESITVSSEPNLLDFGSMELGTNATEKEVHSWPIIVEDGTRQLQSFVFRTMPGTQGNSFQGSVNGGQTFSHEILIDGISLGRMDIAGGSNVEFTATMDAVSEFRLQTGALSAQYGSTQTAVASFGLRSGSNEYHLSLFEFHTNSALNANSWGANLFGNRKEPKLENNFGVIFGGPIRRDRTHFFFSYEGDRYRDHTVVGRLTAPLPEYKRGDFSRLLDPTFTGDPLSGTIVGQDALGRNVVYGQIYDPATSRQLPDGRWIRDPFPGNLIPQNQFSRVTAKILANDDVPNPQLDLFRNNHPATNTLSRRDIDNFSVKLDHVLATDHRLSGSVVFNDRLNYFYGPLAMLGVPFPGSAALGTRVQYLPGWIVRLAEDWTPRATLLNHLAIGYNRLNHHNLPGVFGQKDWAMELGLVGVGGATFPVIRFSGASATLRGFLLPMGNDFAALAPNGSTILQDDLTWLAGRHSFRTGLEHRRYYTNNRNILGAGNYRFHNENTALPGFPNQTGFSYASFLLGAAFATDLYLPYVTMGIRSRNTSFYFQDDWKLTSRLVLNLGVRWEIPQPLAEVAQRMSSLAPDLPNPGAGGRPGALAFLGDCRGCTGRSSFAKNYYRQWAPRVGLTYAATEKIVVRAGYGINFSPPILDGFDFPYEGGFNGSNPINPRRGRFREDPVYNWDNPYPWHPLTLPNRDPSLLNGLNIGYYLSNAQHTAYVQNWNLGIQYELPCEARVEANYVGNKGTRLNESDYKYLLNQVDSAHLSLGDALVEDIADHPEIPLPYLGFQGSVAQALRPFPQYYDVSTHRLGEGWSAYHSVQVTVTKRSNHGLNFLAAYTFSKALANTDSAGPGIYSYAGQDFYRRTADYSVTSFHFPQDLKMSWTYELPFGVEGRWLKTGPLSKILSGWSASTIQRYRSGDPLGLYTEGFDTTALFNPQVRADVVLPRGQQVIGKPNNPDVFKGRPYLNPAAFAAPPKTDRDVPVRLGNAPRFLSNLRGFAYLSEDFALIKRSALNSHGGAQFELRIDAVNFFNRIRLDNPDTTVGYEGFGRVFGKSGNPRNIQVGIRLSF
ncbi:MAG: TonB-dependent receptor [Acidobacteriota bacterium]